MKRKILLKSIALALMAAIAFTSLTGCATEMNTETQVSQPIASTVTALTSSSAAALTATTAVPRTNVKTEDTDSTWDAAAATKITLNGTSATVSGAGAAVNGSVITISKAGTYVVSGKLTNGQIVVAATTNDTVRLILNGAEIINLTGAPIYASQCDKLILTLADGTENTVTDGGENFVYADETNEEPNAAIFSKDDMTINGTGALTVNAGFNNGIGTKDDLIVASGNLIVNAANHGLRGNDSVTILNGVFQIKAGNDGIQTSNGTDADKGWIAIEGGTFTLITVHDGIQAETSLNISAGTFNITAGGGVAKAQTITTSETTSDSYKGIKAGADMTISGGTFTIDSADDTVHTNANATISDGEFMISSGDDGVHADGDLTISGGKITVTESYEGLEGNNVYITNGTVSIVASDDGINAAGGNDGSGAGGNFGDDRFVSSGSHSININGGSVKIIAGSDGLDSNGTLNISGGLVITQSIAVRDGDAIDTDGTVTFTGGTIIYAGTLSTGVNSSESSTQSYVYATANISAGDNITVKKNGKALVLYTPDANIKYLALSSPDIKSGESYEIYNGSTLIVTATAGTGGGGGMGGRGGMGGGGKRP
jgi:hypothetical protein